MFSLVRRVRSGQRAADHGARGSPARVSRLDRGVLSREMCRACGGRATNLLPPPPTNFPRPKARATHKSAGGHGSRMSHHRTTCCPRLIGASVAQWLARSPPTNAIRARSPVESCWTMPLSGVFSRGTPASPTLTALLHPRVSFFVMFRDDGYLRVTHADVAAPWIHHGPESDVGDGCHR
ncbi:hypothetical protein PR048_017061 [Dryococelus australis]|uniref:Uncharacterized protein n=1 Tax=Dryococelus australis TaxID=614101 RepID=A0ABQ9H8G0_9NEOP|nr:hypothetical protein PR048_017061 [Dryococelus australis]